jgi:hypothetical protein
MAIYKSILDIGGKKKVVVSISHKEETEQQVVESKVVNKLHHIHILDRSGSMAYSINQLIDNVQKTIEVIGENDLLTIIWFSSAGQHRTVLKGANKMLEMTAILNSLRSVIGCTCFSDPLKEVNIILDEIGDLAPVSVTLFTDGQPVVPWGVPEEEHKCMIELEKMKGKIIAFNTVGYGNYYNQELLKAFSATSEFGTMFHSSNIDEYLTIFNHNFEKISDAVVEDIKIHSYIYNDVIYLNRTFTKMTECDFELSRIDKRKNQFFLVAENEDDFIFTYQGTSYNSADIKKAIAPATIQNFYYAYAYNLYYSNRRLESLDILSKNLQDKALIDSHLSSFTFDESAVHIEKLRKATMNNKCRLIEGQAPVGYLPADDAKCVMDVLAYLQTINAYYIPFSKNIEAYSRITRKATDEFNLFTKTEDEIRVPFSDFVFNKKHMNLSIRVYVPGKVAINPMDAKEVGLPTEIDSGIFRNYTIIKDGNLNIKKIEVLIPAELVSHDYMNFIDHIEINDELYARVVVDLSAFPIINRMYINKATDIDNIFEDVQLTTELEARQKLIGYFIDNILTDTLKKTGALKEYTVAQIRVLEKHGLDKNLNYGGVEITKAKAEDSDSYESRTMEFYLAGFSSWPKVSDMLERINNGKKMTVSMQTMYKQYLMLENEATARGVDLSKESTKTRNFLFAERDEVKQELILIRINFAILKLAKLLSGDWFHELKTDDKGEYFYEKNDVKMIAKTSYTTEYF